MMTSVTMRWPWLNWPTLGYADQMGVDLNQVNGYSQVPQLECARGERGKKVLG